MINQTNTSIRKLGRPELSALNYRTFMRFDFTWVFQVVIQILKADLGNESAKIRFKPKSPNTDRNQEFCIENKFAASTKIDV